MRLAKNEVMIKANGEPKRLINNTGIYDKKKQRM